MNVVFAFLEENWLNLLLVLVGLSAFVTYFWQKRDSKRAAATLLKSQIDSVEKSILQLKNDHDLGNQSVYNSGKILSENLWEKYKHLFVKELSQSEIDLIQRFFDNAEQIERTRADITKSMMLSWEQHGAMQHNLACNLIEKNILSGNLELSDTKARPEGWNDFEKRLDRVDFGYTPDLVIKFLIKALDNFVNLTGTTAYEKIRKLSFER